MLPADDQVFPAGVRFGAGEPTARGEKVTGA
jgi:hypothetical protein